MRQEVGGGDTLDAAVRLGLELVPSAAYAGITWVQDKNRVTTPAASHGVPTRIDELQGEYQQGPCLDAIRKEEVVYTPNLSDDDRWPEWGPQVVRETGVHSMMCFRLFTNGDNLGALNFHATTPDTFTETDHEHGLAFAAHAAIAVSAAIEIEGLREAADARTVIGQAQGVLIERHSISPQHAFTVLARVSAKRELKLRQVAEELVASAASDD